MRKKKNKNMISKIKIQVNRKMRKKKIIYKKMRKKK